MEVASKGEVVSFIPSLNVAKIMPFTNHLQRSFEMLEPRLPLSADTGTLPSESLGGVASVVVRPELTAPQVVLINNELVGPAPITFEKASFFGDDVERFIVGAVSSGVVEKYEPSSDSWTTLATRPTTGDPRALLEGLADRVFDATAQIRWTPGIDADLMQQAFMVIGWNEGLPLPAPVNDVPGRQLANLVIDLADRGGALDLAWLSALPSPAAVEPTHFFPVTTINGEVPPGELRSMQHVQSLVPNGLLDSFGRQVVIHRGVREAGTRVGIHIHEYGGYTLVLSGTITDFVQGVENKTYSAGQWYYMPSNTPMAAANLGSEDAELIDIFFVTPGKPTITILEPGYPPS